MGSSNLSIHQIISKAVDKIGSRLGLGPIMSSTLYRNALYLMINTVVTALLGFFFWMVVARFYSETEVGYGSAAISAINLLALLSIVGLNLSVIRFLPQVGEPRKLINSSFTLSGLISLFTATIFIAVVNYWSPALSFVKQNALFYLTMVIVVILSTLSNLMDSVFVARRSAGFMLSKNVIVSFLRIPVVIALSIFLHTFGVVASWGIALGIAFAISVFLFLPRLEVGYKPVPTLSTGQFKNMWHYSAGSYLATLLEKAPTMILPLMVLNLLGTESNAYFYIAWMIATVLSAIPGSVSRSLFAEGSHSVENFKENVTRSIKFAYLLLVPAAVVLIAVARWLLLLFGPGYSTNALVLLWLLILANLPRVINNVYSGILRVQGRLKEMVLIRGFVAVAVLIVTFFCISDYGILAIGYVWLGVQIIVSIALAFRLGSWSGGFSKNEVSDWEDGTHL